VIFPIIFAFQAGKGLGDTSFGRDMPPSARSASFAGFSLK
jgi:hypothetical protein